MAIVLVMFQDTDEGPAVSIVSEPHLTIGEGQVLTLAQGLAVTLVEQLNQQTAAHAPAPKAPEKPELKLLMPGDPDPADPFSFN